MDLRRGQKGMSVQAIAEVWNVDAVEIEKTLELAQSSAGKDRRFEEVNRTVSCRISRLLMNTQECLLQVPFSLPLRWGLLSTVGFSERRL